MIYLLLTGHTALATQASRSPTCLVSLVAVARWTAHLRTPSHCMGCTDCMEAERSVAPRRPQRPCVSHHPLGQVRGSPPGGWSWAAAHLRAPVGRLPDWAAPQPVVDCGRWPPRDRVRRQAPTSRGLTGPVSMPVCASRLGVHPDWGTPRVLTGTVCPCV